MFVSFFLGGGRPLTEEDEEGEGDGSEDEDSEDEDPLEQFTGVVRHRVEAVQSLQVCNTTPQHVCVCVCFLTLVESLFSEVANPPTLTLRSHTQNIYGCAGKIRRVAFGFRQGAASIA